MNIIPDSKLLIVNIINCRGLQKPKSEEFEFAATARKSLQNFLERAAAFLTKLEENQQNVFKELVTFLFYETSESEIN